MQRRQLVLGATALFAAGCASQADSAVAEAPPPPVQTPTIRVVFATATEGGGTVSPEMQAALSRLAEVLCAKLGRPVRALTVTDAESGRLDAAAGRALIDGINARYGLALTYEDSPYLLVLPEASAPGSDAMLAASFAGQSADQMLQSLTAITAATEATETRRLNFSAIIEHWKDTWAQISPVHTQTGRPVASAQPHT